MNRQRVAAGRDTAGEVQSVAGDPVEAELIVALAESVIGDVRVLFPFICSRAPLLLTPMPAIERGMVPPPLARLPKVIALPLALLSTRAPAAGHGGARRVAHRPCLIQNQLAFVDADRAAEGAGIAPTWHC